MLFDKLEELVYALTLSSRPKNRAKWMTKGFSKVPRARLVAYWGERLSNQDPKDLAMFAEILEGYKVALARREKVSERIRQEQQHRQEALDKLRGSTESHSELPGAAKMAKTAAVAAFKWVGSGFSSASETTIQKRKEICAGCEYWDSGALKQTGRCRKCGCSTWAKIRMATESCPEGKWGKEA